METSREISSRAGEDEDGPRCPRKLRHPVPRQGVSYAVISRRARIFEQTERHTRSALGALENFGVLPLRVSFAELRHRLDARKGAPYGEGDFSTSPEFLNTWRSISAGGADSLNAMRQYIADTGATRRRAYNW